MQTYKYKGEYICPHCNKNFPLWYWGVSGHVGGWGTIRKPGLAKANFKRHRESCKIKTQARRSKE